MLRFIATALALCCVTTAADAAVTITISQVGANVVAQATGTFDRSGISNEGYFSGPGNFVNASQGAIGFGNEVKTDRYVYAGAAFSLGSGSYRSATTGSGTAIQIYGVDNVFGIDSSYVSNSALTASATWANETLASLGLTTGTRTASVGRNMITVQVLPAVPEPATWAMMTAGFALVGAATRRRRGVRVVAA